VSLFKLKTHLKIWECDCGNKDQAKIITALDGEVVCGICGTVLGEVRVAPQRSAEQVEGWSAEADLCRKILEDRVSRK